MAINVHGDSMEPTLKDSEIILIDKEEVDISSGGVFVISTNTGLFVKRPYVDEDGNIQLLSDNRDYTPHIICKDEQESVLILGKVVQKTEQIGHKCRFSSDTCAVSNRTVMPEMIRTL